MILFLLKSAVLLLMFLFFYLLFLQKEKIFFFNRWFLLLAMLASLVIPIISISSQTIGYKSVLLQTINLQNAIVIKDSSVVTFNFLKVFSIIYLLGLAYFAVRFFNNLYDIFTVIKNSEKIYSAKDRLILLENQVVPHSFFHFIFLNKNDYYNQKIAPEIIFHEKMHGNQLHSLDVLLVEILKIVFWFNPIFKFYKNAIQLNHEFLADQTTIQNHQDIAHYQNTLLEYISIKSNQNLACNVNFSITKKRFMMMTKNSNPTTKLFKKLLIVPLFLVAIAVFSNQSFAQNDPVFTELGANGIKPDFPGGIKAFYSYFLKNFKLPQNAGSLKARIQTTFVIEKDGSVSDIKILKSSANKFDEQIIQTLKNSPKWIAGKKNGMPVRMLYKLPISIVLD